MPDRELYFQEGIRYLPKVIELCDRNRLSPAYGCFDRAYWHYRTSDFPSGMYQECVLPLAIAYQLEHAKNPFFKEDRLKELVKAGIDFARRSSHRDGSCDDYFPYERATGAAAFSLYALTESCLLLGINEPPNLEFFKRRAQYLAAEGYRESGILSNHKALIVLALFNVYLVTREERFKKLSQEKLNQLLKLQTNEGWFPEYEGADPGYLTFTVDFLAKYYLKSQDEKVVEPLKQAIRFSSFFMHPDGSYGGEYGSRNTFHFLPHGFELMGGQSPEAVSMCNLFLKAIQNGKRSYLEDDRIFVHFVYNFLQAYSDFFVNREEATRLKPVNFTQTFKEAGLIVKNKNDFYAVISVTKGGVSKIFKGQELVWNDSGLLGETEQGRKFTSQIMNGNHFQIDGDRVEVEGDCYEHQDVLLSPFKLVLFRCFLLLIGRFLPANVTRRMLQKKAILKSKKKFRLHFKKVFSFGHENFVELRLQLETPSLKVKELWIGTDPTFIYVATSRPYQSGSLKEWIDLSTYLSDLNQGKEVSFRRSFA